MILFPTTPPTLSPFCPYHSPRRLIPLFLRNGNFLGNSGHPPRPAPTGTGMRISYLDIEQVWGIYKNPNQV